MSNIIEPSHKPFARFGYSLLFILSVELSLRVNELFFLYHYQLPYSSLASVLIGG